MNQIIDANPGCLSNIFNKYPIINDSVTQIELNDDYFYIPLLQKKFDVINAPLFMRYINEYWGDTEYLQKATDFVLQFNTGVAINKICKSHNWKRKRFLTDISYLRVKCGYPPMHFTDWKIPPSRTVCKYIPLCVKEEREMELNIIENGAEKSYWKKRYKKMIGEGKFTSRAFERTENKYFSIKPIYRKAKGDDEIFQNKTSMFEERIKRNSRKIPEVVNKVPIPGMDYIEINPNFMLREKIKKGKNVYLNSIKNIEECEKDLEASWEKSKGVKAHFTGESAFIKIENFFEVLGSIKQENIDHISVIDREIEKLGNEDDLDFSEMIAKSIVLKNSTQIRKEKQLSRLTKCMNKANKKMKKTELKNAIDKMKTKSFNIKVKENLKAPSKNVRKKMYNLINNPEIFNIDNLKIKKKIRVDEVVLHSVDFPKLEIIKIIEDPERELRILSNKVNEYEFFNRDRQMRRLKREGGAMEVLERTLDKTYRLLKYFSDKQIEIAKENELERIREIKRVKDRAEISEYASKGMFFFGSFDPIG